MDDDACVEEDEVVLEFFLGAGPERDWPAKRVSGEAVRLMLRDSGGMAEFLASGSGDGEFFTS